MRNVHPSFQKINTHLSITFLLLLFCSRTNAQQENQSNQSFQNDTILINELLEKAEAYGEKYEYDSVFYVLEQANEIFEKRIAATTDSAFLAKYHTCQNLLGSNYTNKNENEKARNILNDILAFSKGKFMDTNPLFAKTHKHLGDIDKNEGKYNEAIVKYEEALDLMTKNKKVKSSDYASVYVSFGSAYEKVSKYDESLKMYEKALSYAEEEYGKEHFTIGVCYNGIGMAYVRKQELNKGLINMEKALDIYLPVFGETHSMTAQVISNLGVVYAYNGDIPKAIEYFQKALEIKQQTLDSNDPGIASSYGNLSIININAGRYDLALEYQKKALKIRQNSLGDMHPDLANSYNSIGTIYREQGKVMESGEYYQKALDIQMKTVGENDEATADILTNIAIFNIDIGNHNDAIEKLNKVLDIRKEIFDQNHPAVANCYLNLGQAYSYLRENEKAMHNYKKALTMRKKIYGEMHLLTADAYINVATIHDRYNQFELAYQNYEKALKIRKKLLHDRSPLIAADYLNISSTLLKEGRYRDAIDTTQNALSYLVDNFKENDFRINPDFINNHVFSKPILLDILRMKANALFLEYKDTSKENLWPTTLETNELIVELVRDMSLDLSRGGSKLLISKKINPSLELAIEAVLLSIDKKTNLQLAETTFSFFEQNKDVLLIESLNSTEAKKFSGLDEDEINFEKELIANISFYEKEIFEEKQNIENSDSIKIQQWQNEVFILKEKHDSLTTKIRNENPAYYNLLYDHKTVGVEEIKNDLLHNNQALLEYFTGDSSIYAFIITKKNYEIIEIKKDFPLDSLVRQLQQNTYTCQLTNCTETGQQNEINELNKVAHELYQRIFQPIENAIKLPKELIIIPDGVLGYVPFEMLLKELPEKQTSFSSYSYLIKDYQISYCYSATLLHEMQQMEKGKTKKNFLAFAPSFGDDESVASANRSISDIRGELGKLRYNVPEVTALQVLMGGDVFTGNEATEDAFKQHAPDYRIIHLATHGKANDQVGDYAYLAFTEVEDSLENELLYNRDLYNLRLNADLVVLSACETGIGELQRGEGIISLARGFSYAGARSIVTTLWSINDATTKELMEGFYTNIKAGMTKDAALRQAKLDYIENHPNNQVHPFYWAAFVPIGDMSPVELGGSNWWMWALGGLLLLALIFFFRNK